MMAATLGQLKAAHESSIAQAEHELGELDAQRPPLALDDSAALAKLDEQRACVLAEVERHTLALEELDRREQAERQAQAARERQALEAHLRALLSAQQWHARQVREAVEQLGRAIGEVEDDEAEVFEVAAQLRSGDSPHAVMAHLAPCVFGRFQKLLGVPDVSNLERVGAVLLAVAEAPVQAAE